MIWTAVLPWSRPEPDPTAAAPALQAIMTCKLRGTYPAIRVSAEENYEGWLESKRRVRRSVSRCFANVRAQAYVHPSTVQASWQFNVPTEAACIPDVWLDMYGSVVAFGFQCCRGLWLYTAVPTPSERAAAQLGLQAFGITPSHSRIRRKALNEKLRVSCDEVCC